MNKMLVGMFVSAGLLSGTSVAFGNVVLNEVLGSTTGDDTEYIELFNSGSGSIDISNWRVEFWESDAGITGAQDGMSPYTVPANTVILPNGFYLFANSLTETFFEITGDVLLPEGAIENSSYTIVLKDAAGTALETIFVSDGGENDVANIDGIEVTADLNFGPDGAFLPAGFNRNLDTDGVSVLLEFSPKPALSGTPTGQVVEPPVEALAATIMEIQGAAHTSPLLGRIVITAGVVTAVDSNGFYLQDLEGDGDDATSDALFVFTGAAPELAVGDLLELSGTVSEFFPGGESSRNLSTTQLSSATITIAGEAILPVPVLLGNGGRAAPVRNIDDDAFAEFDPINDGIDYFESLEGMRVTIPEPLAIAPTNRFGELFTVANNGSGSTGISERQTLNISEDDFNPEKIQIDEDTAILPGFDLPAVNVGAQLEDVTGVVSYGFGNYEIYPTEPFGVVDSALLPETTTITDNGGTLRIASYNVLNLDPNDGDGDTDIANGRFDAIAGHIVQALGAPDILGLQEIQDNNGSETGDEVSASVTLSTLIDAIVAAGGPVYSYIDTTGLVPNSVGGQPGGNIRVAYLYNTDRVQLLGEASPLTDLNDQASNPDNPFSGSRVSLAADFQFMGSVLTVVNNHLSSKGGSAPIFGTEQPFEALQEDPSVNGSLDERERQTQAVSEFVSLKLSEDVNANVVVLGDMNEFEFVSPIRQILGAQLTNTIDLINDLERYSFIFQGNSQQLDHILVSQALAQSVTADIVHVNSEFIENDERASDHDPVIIGLDLSAPEAMSADLDNDGDTDVHDYRLFVRTLGSRIGHKRYRADADYNRDGRINRRDLREFLSIYREALAVEMRGDIDRDGDIDRVDLRLLRRALWTAAGDRKYNPDADLNDNNRVNRRDYRLFQQLLN